MTAIAQDVELRPVTWIHEDFEIRGTVRFENIAQIRGRVHGEIHAADGSTLIIAESAVVEGSIFCDEIIVEGFVRGKISARKKLEISSTGRILGEISSPQLKIAIGGILEGESIRP